MIIACPACGTRYAVPESAIGGDGRTVRCAKCKHSWFQPPASALEAGQAPENQTFERTPDPKPTQPTSEPEPASSEAEGFGVKASQDEPLTSPEADPEPVSENAPSSETVRQKTSEYASDGIASQALRQGLGAGGKAEDRARSEPVAPSYGDETEAEPPPAIEPETDPLADDLSDMFANDANDLYDDDHVGDYSSEQAVDYSFDEDSTEDEAEDVSQFDYSPPFTVRRSPLKMWAIAAAVFALLATGTVFAVNYYGLPSWLPFNQPTFGIGKPDLELDFPAQEQRSESLESGEKIFRVRGTVTNTGRESIAVPNLLIVFRDDRNRPVGEWLVAPSKSSLAPGERLNVTEAIADIPVTADAAEIGWAPN